MPPPSAFESFALVVVSFAAGLTLAITALLLGQWRAVEVVGVVAIVALPFTIWRGWFAGRQGGDNAG